MPAWYFVRIVASTAVPVNVDTLVGAFTATRFVAANDVFDVTSYLEDASEAARNSLRAMAVTEDIVYLQIDQAGVKNNMIRIPRAI